MHWEATGTAAAKFVACRKEAFARVAFAEERLMLIAELVPERVEGFVMGTVDYMAQPERKLQSAFST